MLVNSIGTVDQTEWCLKYNYWSESVEVEPIVTPGTMWVGMGNSLLRFPNTNKNVFFRNQRDNGGEGDITQPPISVRTMDGLIVNLQMEFTYRLDMAKLRDLYMLVGESTSDNPLDDLTGSGMQSGWHGNLVNLAVGVIDNWSTKFVAREFIVNRSLVNLKFQEELIPELKTKLFIDLATLQLQDVEFPMAKAYEQSIQDTTSWLRKVELATQEQKTKEIQQQTLWKTAQELANKTIIQSQGDAQQILLNNQAEVAQFKYRQEKDAAGYKQQLDFFRAADPTNAVNHFFKYMETRALKVHVDGNTVLKLSSAPTR